MTDTWDFVPAEPLVFRQGITDPRGRVHVVDQQFELRFERAIQLLFRQLPSKPGEWCMVHDLAERRVLAFKHYYDGDVTWAGCKIGFDTLAQWHDTEATAWAAFVAQNLGLLDVRE